MGFKLRLFKSATFASSSASSSNSDLHNQLSETTTTITTATTRTSSTSSSHRHRDTNNNSPTPPQSPKKKKFLHSITSKLHLLGSGAGDSDWLAKQPLKYPGKPDPACLATLNAFQWGNNEFGNNGAVATRMLSYCSTTISPGTSRRGSLA